MLSTRSVIAALARVILHTTNTSLDALRLVGDLLAGLRLNSVGMLSRGADALKAGALALATAGLHAVKLVARLALHRLTELGLIVDGLASGAGEGVERPCA